MLHRWLGYQAGIRQPFSFFFTWFFKYFADCGFLGLGRCKILRTVEAARNMFSIFSWLEIRTRPQSILSLEIRQTSAANNYGVLFQGCPTEADSSLILFNRRYKVDREIPKVLVTWGRGIWKYSICHRMNNLSFREYRGLLEVDWFCFWNILIRVSNS